MKPDLILINDKNYSFPDDLELIIEKTLEVIDHPKNVSVNVILVDEKTITNLNKKYRQINKPTDVLSFELNILDPETGILMLGEIIISVPFVEMQAQSLGNDLFDEIRLMVIHGLLHLFGYDHDNDENRSEMWDFQTKILVSLQIRLKSLPE